MRVFHFLSVEYALEALRDQRLKIATLNELNDPFELLAADLSDRSARKRFKIWKKQVSESTGLLCFSRRWKNPLLWSHYADRHRGIALEFDVHDDFVIPVRYRPNRLPLDFSEIEARGRFGEELAEELFSTKAQHWAYEEEVRVSVSLAECEAHGDLYFEPLNSRLRIVGAIIGPFCTASSDDVQEILPAGMMISLVRARIAFRTFDVVRNKRFSVERLYGDSR